MGGTTFRAYNMGFKWMDTVFGVCFGWVWLSGVKHLVRNPTWQLLWALAGLCAPFMLIYFGHIDTYASVFLGLLAWLLVLVHQLENRSKRLLWGLLVGLLICIKLHPLNVMLAPIWVLACISSYDKRQSFGFLLTYKGLATILVIPAFVIGFILYFLVFEDHIDERSLQNIRDFDRLFLPILSPDPPLDRYNMFSWNHIVDYVNVVMSWSPIAWCLVLGLVVTKAREIDWEDHRILLVGAFLVLLVCFLFAINPLVSMPMDWDLFSIPIIPLLVLGLLVTRQLERSGHQPGATVVGNSVAVALLVVPAFVVNATPTLLSHRLETVGIHVFKTYYEHGREVIYFSQNMIDRTPEELLQRKRSVAEQLAPYANVGKDPSYATLLTDLGAHQLVEMHDPRAALETLRQGPRYYPNHRDNLLFQVQAYYILGEYKTAASMSMDLVRLNYPSRQKALRMSIHLALEAEEYQLAQRQAVAYLAEFPDDPTIKEILRRLSNNDRVETVKEMFSR